MNYLAFERVLLGTKLLCIVTNAGLRLQKFQVQFCPLAEEPTSGGHLEATWPTRLGVRTVSGKGHWSSLPAPHKEGSALSGQQH